MPHPIDWKNLGPVQAEDIRQNMQKSNKKNKGRYGDAIIRRLAAIKK